MAETTKKEYKKLSARRYWARYVKLWIGKDHLLLCDSLGYTEDYRRVYFRDVQAILIRPHTQRLVWSIVWGAFLAFFMILMGALHASDNWFLWVMGGLSLLFFLINLSLGPGCRCHLKTAVQTVELPINRLRKAGKIIERLKPLIEGAQTNLPAGPAPVPTLPSPAGAGVPAGGTLLTASTGKTFRPYTHWILFTLLILQSLSDAIMFFDQVLGLYLTAVGLELAVALFVIIALIRQTQGDAAKKLRKITILTLVCVILNFVLGSIMGAVDGLHHPQLLTDQWDMIKWSATQPPGSSVLRMANYIFDILYSFILGLIGLIELTVYQRSSSNT